jgi:hypothetical protein
MAVVYRARDERLGRSIALKVMAPQWAEDEEFRHRFVAESRAAASVDDPHVIPVYQAGAAGGVLFIAMRLVAGTDLRGVLRREGVLPPGRALELLSPVASALDAAHAAGLVHRDVKPGNILVDELPGRPDHVYLSDFGLSKGVAAGMSLTGPGTYLGTPRYSAPEQVQGNRVDGRADQYALACVAFELLAGRAPFERDHPMAVMLAHLSEPPPSLAGRRPALPVAVDRVMARALAKVPEQRYASCRDFADALREALGLTPYGAGSTAMSGRLHTDTFAPPVPGGPTEAGALRQPGAAARESGSLAPGPGTTVGLERPPGPAQVLTVSDGVRSRPAPGDGEMRPTRHPRRGLLVIALTGAVLAAAVVIPRVLAQPGPPGASSPSTTATKTTARTQGATALSGPPTDLPPDPGRADQDVTSVAFKPGTTTLAVGHGNGSVSLWNTTTKTKAATLTAPAGSQNVDSDPVGRSVNSMAFEPGTATLALGYIGGNVYLWDTTTKRITATLIAPVKLPSADVGPFRHTVVSVAFGPGTATTLAAGYENGNTYLWRIKRDNP